MKKRKKNPLMYAIYAKKPNGPEMTFNGFKFTNNSHPKFFSSKETAYKMGRSLVNHYPHILSGYRVTVRVARGAPRLGASRRVLRCDRREVFG